MGKRPRGRGFNPYQWSASPPSQAAPLLAAMRRAMNFAAHAPDLAKIERKVDAAGRAGWKISDEWIARIRAIAEAKREAQAMSGELVELYIAFALKVGFPRGWTATDRAAALFVIYNRIARGEPVFPEAHGDG